MKKLKAVVASAMIIGTSFAVAPAFAENAPGSAVTPSAEQELRCGIKSDGTAYCEYVIKW